MPILSRRTWLRGVAALSLSQTFLRRSLFGAMTMQKKRVFVGTYTKSTSHGIYAYDWNSDSGELKEIGVAIATPDPSFLALSPDGKNIYAVNELDAVAGSNKETGTVSSFAVASDARLTLHNTVPSGGNAPCNMAVDHTGRALFVANYTSGSVSSYQISEDEKLSTHVENIHYSGHSVGVRQKSAHTHCTTVSPDNRFLLVNDLGLDRIMVYRISPATAEITPNDPPFYSAIPGSGPRNFTFHPNHKWAYSLNEIASTIDALHWGAENGTLTRVQNLSTLAHPFAGTNTAATVLVHPNGRFVYASNRGDDSMVVYSVDQATGALTLLQHISCGGKTPRNFILDPSGRWVLIANQDSANIVVLQCDAKSGHLSATGRQYALDSPVCIIFA